MEYRKAGELEVSVLGFGTWQFGSKGGTNDYWGVEFTQNMANDLLQLYARGGTTYFDTAEVYGDGSSESQLGVALKSLDETTRKKVVIGTKIPPNGCSENEMRSHLEGSLKRLDVPCIDLYMIHWPIDSNSMAHFAGGHAAFGESDHAAIKNVPDTKKAFQMLMEFQKEGKIKHIGVSNFGVQQLKEALSTGVKISANQVVYNLLCRAVEFEILPFCQQHNIGIFAYMPLMQGLISSKWKSADEVPEFRARTRHFVGTRPRSRHGEAGAEKETFEALAHIRQISEESHVSITELALAWPLVQPGVTCVIVGSTKEEQALENLKAIQTKLTPEVVQKLNQATAVLKEKLGGNADLWQGNSNSRIK